MKELAWTVAIFGMIAGSIKVYNELEMTKQYARWADASVRQAEALERASPPPIKSYVYRGAGGVFRFDSTPAGKGACFNAIPIEVGGVNVFAISEKMRVKCD